MELSVHFTRVAISQIDLSDSSQEQFEISRFVEAARLLADAQVDVIAWGGTSGGWLGSDWDRNLCNEIHKKTGIPAITAMTAQIAAFQIYQARSIGLFVPYVEELVHPIMKNFSKAGFLISSEVHLNVSVNTEIARINGKLLDSKLNLLSGNIDFISAFCTNLATAPYVEDIEKRANVIVFDSVLVLIWALCQTVGIYKPIPGWGQLLYDNPALPTSNREPFRT